MVIAVISQRDRAAWWVSLGQSGRRYSADIIGLSSTTVKYGLEGSKPSISLK